MPEIPPAGGASQLPGTRLPAQTQRWPGQLCDLCRHPDCSASGFLSAGCLQSLREVVCAQQAVTGRGSRGAWARGPGGRGKDKKDSLAREGQPPE